MLTILKGGMELVSTFTTQMSTFHSYLEQVALSMSIQNHMWHLTIAHCSGVKPTQLTHLLVTAWVLSTRRLVVNTAHSIVWLSLCMPYSLSSSCVSCFITRPPSLAPWSALSPTTVKDWKAIPILRLVLTSHNVVSYNDGVVFPCVRPISFHIHRLIPVTFMSLPLLIRDLSSI